MSCSCSPTLQSQCASDTEPAGYSMDSYAGPDIAPLEESADQFPDSEFRPAEEVLAGPGLDLDFLQQRGTQSSSVSQLAR